MDIKEYRFENGNYSFSILNLGCAVTSICCPDRDGNVKNVTLPFPNHEDVLKEKGCFGLTVGRFANRIANASFMLNGRKWSFEPNDNGNLLHSGPACMAYRIWDVRKMEDGFLCYLKVSQEEDGFPGTMQTYVRFSLTGSGVFSIHYKCICDEDVPVNMTNHTYFNLTGEPEQDILSHRMQMNSSRHLEVDDKLIPTGVILDNKGSIYDFSEEKEIGRDIDAKGYDHCYLVDRPDGQSRGYIRFAHVYEPQSGRIMSCYTDLPAFHFYTGNCINGSCGYQNRHGFCLETEFCPDYVNHPEFFSGIIKANEVFESTTSFKFYTDKQEGLSCLK